MRDGWRKSGIEQGRLLTGPGGPAGGRPKGRVGPAARDFVGVDRRRDGEPGVSPGSVLGDAGP